MIYFQYKKKDGQIKAMSAKKPTYNKDIFSLKSFDLAKKEKDFIKQGYRMKIIKGKLKFEEPENIKKQKNIEELKTEIEDANDIDKLKKIITKLI